MYPAAMPFLVRLAQILFLPAPLARALSLGGAESIDRLSAAGKNHLPLWSLLWFRLRHTLVLPHDRP
jgi:hypothetical protein